MVHLVKKTIKGKVYLYLEERAWIDGKSKRISSIYLGPEDKIHKLNIDANPKDFEYESLDFGLSMALYKIAKEIDLVPIIDSVIGKKREQNLSRGEYILLAILQRCCQPGSKSQMSSWFMHDYISTLFKIEPEILNPQTYWNQFQSFEEKNIEIIEEKLIKKVIEVYNLDLNTLLFDPTNFFTFQSFHSQESLTQFGHSKERRDNLRIINVSILSTLEDGIPLFHLTYKGNTQDAKHFKGVLNKIHTRFDQYEQNLTSLILIFDKGNHSPEAFKEINSLQLPFIASLKNSTQKDLLTIPENRSIPINLPHNNKKISYYALERVVYEKNRTLYVTIDPKKQTKAKILFEKTFDKKKANIDEFIKTKLNNKKWRSQENSERKIRSLIGKFPFKDIIKYTITGDFAKLRVTIFIDDEVKNGYISSFGRSIIFTNLSNWDPVTVIQAFRDKYIIEDIFKRLKNPHYLSIRPMYHWSTTCTRAHVFSCFLGMLLLSLLRKKLKQSNISTSYDELIENLSTIKVTKVISSSTDQSIIKLNKLSQKQNEFFDSLNLNSFLSR